MLKTARYALYALLICCFAGLVLLIAWRTETRQEGKFFPGSMHFVLIMPEEGSTREQVLAAVETIADTYRLDVEIHSFTTVSEQVQMLSVLPWTEVDGVILWPISSNDADYQENLLALQKADIPVVVVDRDVAQELRKSFIGSGINSDLLVLNQCLRHMDENRPIVVGNRFGSGGDQVVELLFFSRAVSSEFDAAIVQDMKLQQLAQSPPEGYQVYDYLRLEAENARSLQLKYTLTDLFSAEPAPGLFFSLDYALSATAVSAKQSAKTARSPEVQLLCYGDLAESLDSLQNGVIDGLVSSRPEVSVAVGLRYLRDICRNYWVPATMDSGINYLTVDELPGERNQMEGNA